MTGAIILAAGESRRMGTQKALLPFGEGTVISHIAAQFVQSQADQVCVVTGHQPEGIIEALAPYPVAIAHNAGYKAGMLSSVREGLRALDGGCAQVFVALGDQPTVTPGTINRMLEAYHASEKTILVPVHEGRRGHPLLFSMRYRDEILTEYDGEGLRGLLRKNAAEVEAFPADDPCVLVDMDRPADYERVKRSFGSFGDTIP